jgi:hypothetical protein
MDKVLVLNSDFTPLNVTSLRRGFILVQKGRAEVLQKGDDIITSVGNFVRPLVIRLNNIFVIDHQVLVSLVVGYSNVTTTHVFTVGLIKILP